MGLREKTVWQMLAMATASLALGLGINFFARAPLPLLKALPEAGSDMPAIGEVDADFVLQAGNAPGTLLLDARAGAAYRAGHIPGALSLPLADFAAEFAALAPRLHEAQLLVLYCSDRNCGDSSELARRLWARGLKNLLLYKGGMEDWNRRGHGAER